MQGIGGSKKYALLSEAVFSFPNWKRGLKGRCVILSHSRLVMYLRTYRFTCQSPVSICPPTCLLPACLWLDGSWHPGTRCGREKRPVPLVAPALPSLPRATPSKPPGLPEAPSLICEVREAVLTARALSGQGPSGASLKSLEH